MTMISMSKCGTNPGSLCHGHGHCHLPFGILACCVLMGMQVGHELKAKGTQIACGIIIITWQRSASTSCGGCACTWRWPCRGACGASFILKASGVASGHMRLGPGAPRAPYMLLTTPRAASSPPRCPRPDLVQVFGGPYSFAGRCNWRTSIRE